MSETTPKKKHLDAAAARRIAVAADVDPRTVYNVMNRKQSAVPTRSRQRAREALREAGYDVGGDDE